MSTGLFGRSWNRAAEDRVRVRQRRSSISRVGRKYAGMRIDIEVDRLARHRLNGWGAVAETRVRRGRSAAARRGDGGLALARLRIAALLRRIFRMNPHRHQGLCGRKTEQGRLRSGAMAAKRVLPPRLPHCGQDLEEHLRQSFLGPDVRDQTARRGRTGGLLRLGPGTQDCFAPAEGYAHWSQSAAVRSQQDRADSRALTAIGAGPSRWERRNSRAMTLGISREAADSGILIMGTAHQWGDACRRSSTPLEMQRHAAQIRCMAETNGGADKGLSDAPQPRHCRRSTRRVLLVAKLPGFRSQSLDRPLH